MAGKKPKGKVTCPNCNAELRVPLSARTLQITCPRCHTSFTHSQAPGFFSAVTKTLLVVVILAAIAGGGWYFRGDIANLMKPSEKEDSVSYSGDWVTISYSGLINRSLYTHNQETIGKVLPDIPDYDDSYKGLVQPYFEPYSVLCHDVLLSVNGPDTLPSVNILDQYPVGSEQPAWVALFREGHFQLYYNEHLIRLFIKGTDPNRAVEVQLPVIRLAVNDIINSPNMSIEKIEVYTFVNNYATTELRLNLNPAVFAVADFDLAPHRKSIDLDALDDFLKSGVILEAAEVAHSNDLYFFGKPSNNQTLDGNPVTIADLAVAYRSTFYHGYGKPYASLDQHEDNRYAKVSFGGHLQNTHLGKALLEADKTFKTLTSGIDPNSGKSVVEKITRSVPDFLTRNERSLIRGTDTTYGHVAYWFYPDSIEIVTDGTMALLLKDQFLSEVDHRSVDGPIPYAYWTTAKHINANYGKYKNALASYRELATAARIMAFMNWLKTTDAPSNIELDELLSVRLPACTTPTKLRRMLTVTTVAYPEDSALTAENVRKHDRVYNVSELLEKCSPNGTDRELLDAAGDYVDGLDENQWMSHENQLLNSSLDRQSRIIDERKAQIDSLDQLIKATAKTLDRKDRVALKAYNDMVDDYNRLVTKHQMDVSKYNMAAAGASASKTIGRSISSIIGAIDLDPDQFLLIHDPSGTPALTEVYTANSKMKTSGRVARSGEWRRNLAGQGGAKVNPLPSSNWSLHTSSDPHRYEYNLSRSYHTTLTVSSATAGWRLEIRNGEKRDLVMLSEDEHTLEVSHPELNVVGKGTITQQGRRFDFSR